MKPIKQYLTPHRLYFIFLHVAIIVLAAEVILLSTQNRELHKLMGTPAEPVKVGARFSFAGLRSANGSNPIDTTSRSLLFVFGTRCQYCKRNLAAWESILSAAGENVKPAAISVDSLDATLKYIQENRLQFPVFVATDPSLFKRSNGVGFVPQTLLLGRDGKVEKVWPGVLADSTITEVAIAISAHDTDKR